MKTAEARTNGPNLSHRPDSSLRSDALRAGGVAGDPIPVVYAEVTRLVERLHRRYLDVVRYELGKAGVDDVNPVQALLLLNVQASDLSMRDLVERGYYIGSNVTYNVRQLATSGYLEQQRSERDRRAIKLRLTDKGRALCGQLVQLEKRHAEALGGRASANLLVGARELLRSLERVWTEHVQYGGPNAFDDR